MSSFSSDSNDSTYHGLIANVSSLFGIVIFLQQVWEQASLEYTLITAASSGLAAYLILTVGYAAAQSLVVNGPSPEEKGDAPGDASAEGEQDLEGASDAPAREAAAGEDAPPAEEMPEAPAS